MKHDWKQVTRPQVTCWQCQATKAYRAALNEGNDQGKGNG